MKKKDIFNYLEKLDFAKEDYIVISGASMVVQGIKRETEDIDMAISKRLENTIQDWDNFIVKDYKVYNKDKVDCSNYLFDICEYIVINGIKFATLESIIKLKKEWNRKKDIKDIKKLELAITMKNNKEYENDLHNKGYKLIAGVDEVGRGPLVGPVVAAAVILPIEFELAGLTDSKKLSEKKREDFDISIKEKCISYGIGVIDNNIIDKVNIYEASKLAMIEAINNLKIKPDYVLTDAMKLDINIPTTDIIKGDLKSISISAASVIAKVYRDHLLIELDEKYPMYNFKKNKGYPTKDHINAINKYGIICEHRKTYGPVHDYINKK